MEIIASMEQTLQRQREAQLAEPMPPAAERIALLRALRRSVKAHAEDVAAALDADFGHRSKYDTMLADVLPVMNNLAYCAAHVKSWMKPRRRKAGMLLAPAKVRVMYQPLGVVGIIVPWNFPLMLSVGPLAFALAAGNRVMIKMSEFTPRMNKVVAQLIAEVCGPERVAVFEGEAAEARAFSRLPFDHLLFTGSTATGRRVMAAAAENLTPVTLELGGKSPLVIDGNIPMDLAVERMILGKCMNAGQICIAPDYVLVPKARRDEFVEGYQRGFGRCYGNSAKGADDYTSVVNQRHYERLTSLLEDATGRGARVIDADTTGQLDDPAMRRMSTKLVLGADRGMAIMQEEIFGPLLPVIPYDSLDEAIGFINAGPRPLALYIMSLDQAVQKQLLERTHSGGACINETLMHCTADDAPFGGVGPSGMGRYHGREGFETFSHIRTVLSRGARFNTGKMVQPPYGGLVMRLMLRFFTR